MNKAVLSGNEAIARGAFEAGALVASAYPGTPSTEILENMVRYPEIDASWAPNEKVALEVAIGASFGGGRAIACMPVHLSCRVVSLGAESASLHTTKRLSRGMAHDG